MTPEGGYCRSLSTQLGSSRVQPRPCRVVGFVASSLLAHCRVCYNMHTPSLPRRPRDCVCGVHTSWAPTSQRAKDLGRPPSPGHIRGRSGRSPRDRPPLPEERAASTVTEKNGRFEARRGSGARAARGRLTASPSQSDAKWPSSACGVQSPL